MCAFSISFLAMVEEIVSSLCQLMQDPVLVNGAGRDAFALLWRDW